MAHFYGVMQGQASETTKLGSKMSGLNMDAAGWEGSVHVRLNVRDGRDYAVVSLRPWRGVGENLLLYDGPISGPTEGQVMSELVDWFAKLAEKEGVPE